MAAGERAGDEGVTTDPGDGRLGHGGLRDAGPGHVAGVGEPADEGGAPGAGHVDVVTLGPTTEVQVSGEIDIATNPSFDAALDAARGAGVHLLEMDLSQVTFMGSSGLAALLRAQRLMREFGARLVLVRPSRAVTDLLEMTKLLERFGLGRDQQAQPEDLEQAQPEEREQAQPEEREQAQPEEPEEPEEQEKQEEHR